MKKRQKQAKYHQAHRASYCNINTEEECFGIDSDSDYNPSDSYDAGKSDNTSAIICAGGKQKAVISWEKVLGTV